VGRIDGAELVVLSHASDEDIVREFASRISAAVRELGLHHPRSTVSRFITVSFRVGVGTAENQTAAEFLDDLLSSPPG